MAETARALEEGARLCRERDIRLVVLFIPIMVRVLDPYLEYATPGDRAWAVPGGRTDDPDDFGAGLKRLCGRLDCVYLDVCAALRQAAAADRRDLYLPLDGHLGAAGHRAVARLLAADLRSTTTGATHPGGRRQDGVQFLGGRAGAGELDRRDRAAGVEKVEGRVHLGFSGLSYIVRDGGGQAAILAPRCSL